MIPVCPKCDTALFILNYESVEVDYCDNCRGVWLDAGELERLAAGPLPDLQCQTGAVPPGKKHLCPRCDVPLHEITAPDQLTLDRCPAGHGLWFDADELQQLLATVAGTPLHAVFNQGETS
ncbi:MAG: zf-TFIIB domain-containing protein [Verrucomicrobiota bacterium]